MKKAMLSLWDGENYASKECRQKVMSLVHTLCDCEREVQELLKKEGGNVLERLQDIYGEIASLEKEDAFVQGLTLGIRLVAEAFAE